MALYLHPVAPGQGLLWVRNAFTLFFRRPLAFSALFAMFLVGMVLALTLPWVGSVLVLMALPMLSLGFMVATRSALGGGPVHPGQFIEPLRRDHPQRRKLLQLCGLYALATILMLWLCDWYDGGRFEQLQLLLASGARDREAVDALLADGRLQSGVLLRFGLAGLLSVPFWHAAALVHWGGQGIAQALFSSTLAVWRTRAAFLAYVFAWTMLFALFSLMATLTLALLGMPGAVGLAAAPAALIFSAVFYVSLYFSFTDTFGVPE
jgi:hypothetical protein